MRTRTLAWGLWAVAISLAAGAHVLALASRAPLYGYWIESTLIVPTFATLGALITSRRPGNVIGWLFLVAPIAGGMQFLSGQYATAALSNSTQLPAGVYAAWLSTVMQISTVFTLIFIIMLFPNGRLLSPRWRMVAWTTGLVFAGSLISLALTPGPIQDFASFRNPFGLEAATRIIEVLAAFSGWLGAFCVVATLLSLVLRFYRSRGEERLQLKWFAYAATVGVLAILLGGDTIIGSIVWTLGPLSLPVAAGVAILRYRLYDIGRLINRTLVYGLLTAMLVLVYLGSVFSLQYVFRALAGETPQLVIVASTLAIAALFNPLRRRIQVAVDRRFYRNKYDAQRTLEEFGARLRDGTDLETLGDDLVAVARETVQPAYVSLWLRGSVSHEER